jgi:hypothetical protein
MATKTKNKTNNERLRELVDESGLSQPEALKIFNIPFGARGYSFDAFISFLVNPDSTKFRRVDDDLIAHAEKSFSKYAQKSALERVPRTLYFCKDGKMESTTLSVDLKTEGDKGLKLLNDVIEKIESADHLLSGPQKMKVAWIRRMSAKLDTATDWWPLIDRALNIQRESIN